MATYKEKYWHEKAVELKAQVNTLTEQVSNIEIIADEIEQCFANGDKVQLMALVPLGKIVRLKKALSRISELGGA